MKKILLINEYHYQYIYIYTTRYCYFCIDRESSYRFSNRIFAFEFVFSQKRKKERKKNLVSSNLCRTKNDDPLSE